MTDARIMTEILNTGTNMRVLNNGYSMNTYITGIISCFSKIFAFMCLGRKVVSEWEGLNLTIDPFDFGGAMKYYNRVRN